MLEVSTTAFHTRVRGSFPGLGALKETQMFLTPNSSVKVSGANHYTGPPTRLKSEMHNTISVEK